MTEFIVNKEKSRLREHNYKCSDPLRQEIHKALKDEYIIATKESGYHRVTLRDGSSRGESKKQFLYSFKITPLQSKELEGDKPCRMEVEGKNIYGDIIQVTHQEALIGLAENCGGFIRHLYIFFDLSILIDLLDQSIVNIDRKPSKFNVSLANTLFTDLNFRRGKPLKLYFNHHQRNDGTSLDNNQTEAVQRVLANPFTLIWGPPGTGKTHTLLGVLAELAANGKRIIFASNTNSAIDNVLEKILKNSPYPIFPELMKDNKIIRMGSRVENHDVKSNFSISDVSERCAKNLKIKKERFLLEIEEYNQGLDGISTFLKMWEEKKGIVISYRELENLAAQFPEVENFKRININKSEMFCRYLEIHGKLRDAVKYIIENSTDIYSKLKETRDEISNIAYILGKKQSNAALYRKRHEELSEKINSIKSNFLKKFFQKNYVKNLSVQRKRIFEKEHVVNIEIQIVQKNLDPLVQKEMTYLSQLKKSFRCLEGKAATIEEIFNFTEPYLSFSLEGKHTGACDLLTEMFLREKNLLPDEISTAILNNMIRLLPLMVSLILSPDNNRDIIKESIQKEIQRRNERINKIQSSSKELKRLHPNYMSALKFLDQQSIMKDNIDFQREQFQAEIRKRRNEIEIIENTINKIEEEILKKAQIVSATMIKVCYDKLFTESKFDVLVTDEYSMISLPQFYCVSCLTKERIVLCGDHLQLQPIGRSKSQEARKWMQLDFYQFHEGNYEERIIHFNKGAEKLKSFIAPLNIQRRMPPTISSLVKNWYLKEGNRLEDDWNNSYRIDKENIHPLLRDNIVILDSTPANAYSERSAHSSHFNLVHAGITGEICRQFLEYDGIKPEDIMIMSPYRDQTELIRIIIDQLLPKSDSGILQANVGTIHKSQGRGSPIVIYDLTDGKQKSNVTFFHRNQEPNLLNVALTRSEANLIIICSYDKMISKIGELENYVPLAEIFEKLKYAKVPILSAEDYSNKVFNYIEEGSSEMLHENVPLVDIDKSKIVVLDQTSYYKWLANDLKKEVRKEVLIVSPFITSYRMDKLRPLLLEVIKKGGRLRIITSPPENMFAQKGNESYKGKVVRDILDEWKSYGAEILLVPKIHGKLVVIDNNINYWGSLNPLSWRNTEEVNTRFESADLAEKLSHFVLKGRKLPYKSAHNTISNFDILIDLKSLAVTQLKQFRWRLAAVYKMPYYKFLWNKTIEMLINNLPETKEEFFKIREFSFKNCKLFNHLPEIEEILNPIRQEMKRR